MNKVLFILLSSVLVLSCNAKEEKSKSYSDLFFTGLKGDVIKVEQMPFAIDSAGNPTEMEECCITIMEFDERGYVVKLTEKNTAGDVQSVQSYTRYENGAIKTIDNTRNGEKINTTTYKLDAKGNYASSQSVDHKGKLLSSVKVISVNEYNKTTKAEVYNPDGSLRSSFTNQYDKGMVIGESYFDSTGLELESKTIGLKFNDKGDVIEDSTIRFVFPYGHKEIITRYRYDQYDEQGNWTQMTELYESGSPRNVTKRVITYAAK